MERQSADVLRRPLDELLGSEANIQVLRLLAEQSEPVTAPVAAQRTGLTPPGARKALKRLTESGFVVRVGGGRFEQYLLREQESLVPALRELFRAERLRQESLVQELRETLADVPEISLAWIPRMPARFSQPLEVLVVVGAQALGWIKQELRARLISLERRFDQTIELVVFTRADAPDFARAATLLVGLPPVEGEVPLRRVTHSEREEREERMARAVAELLREDPSLTARATRHVDRLIREGQGSATDELLEWKQILEAYSSQRLIDFLVSTSSRARRLRQSSPFFAVLSADERDRVVAFVERER